MFSKLRSGMPAKLDKI